MVPVCIIGRTRKSNCSGTGPLEPLQEPLPLLTDITVSAADQAVGAPTRIYLGVVTPGADGRFCAEVAGPGTYYLQDPQTGGAPSFVVAAGTGGGTCGQSAASCQDIGELDYYCGY
jgi:hypothetical protein